jgi:hypothetical protein
LSSLPYTGTEKKRKVKMKSSKDARGEQQVLGVTEGRPPLVDALVREQTPPWSKGHRLVLTPAGGNENRFHL